MEKNSVHIIIVFYLVFSFPDLEKYTKMEIYYTSKILSDLWPFGIHRIGDCTYNSCAYVSDM